MSKLSRRLGLAAAVFVAITFGAPLVELWWDCRSWTSEACTWGRAYLQFSFVLWAIPGLVAAALVAVVRWRASAPAGSPGS